MEIAALSTLDDISQAVELFARVWEAPPREQVPGEVFRAATSHGCLLLGARDGSRLAAAVYGTWGRDDDGSVWMYSSRLGVDPAYRGTGVAETLKRAQAKWAFDRGVEELRWTFDPMRAQNAAFNLAKLKAVGIAYYEDLYGPRTDAFNTGERTDRMLVSWKASMTEPSTEQRLIAIPPDYSEYLRLPIEQRRAERDRVRDELRAAFDAGFKAVGFRRPGAYVMTR